MKRAPTEIERLSLREACLWYARLSDDSASGADHDQWQRWLSANGQNQHAWQQVEAINRKMRGIPSQLGSPLLRTPETSRRQVLSGLALMVGAGGLAWLGTRTDTWQAWQSDLYTGIGERRQQTLADGSSLTLNTHSAVQLAFTQSRRELRLLEGEILVATARDRHTTPRPFMIQTRDGQVEALGTRFTVRVMADRTRVAVLDKTVAITPRAMPGQRHLLSAGTYLDFTHRTAGATHTNTASIASWEHGSLIALDMPLGDVLDELGRYRPGVLRCDPGVRAMKISGSFPLNDTDQALSALENGFGLRLVYRTRYWVTVAAVA